MASWHNDTDDELGMCESAEAAMEEQTRADVIRFWMVIVFGGGVCVMSLVCNLYLFGILVKLQKSSPAQFTYLCYLAVMDMMITLCYLLLPCAHGMAVQLNETKPRWSTFLMRCWWSYYMYVFVSSRVCTLGSACILIIASTERLLITYKCRSLALWERNRHQLCGLAMLFAATVNCSLPLEFKLEKVPNCTGMFAKRVETDDAFLEAHPIYTKFWKFYGRNVLSVMLPFTSLITINYAIITKLKSQSILVINISSKKRAVRQASKLMLTIVLTYVVVNSLHVLTTLIEFVNINILFEHHLLYLYVTDFISICTVIACATRLFVYLKFNLTVRDTVMRQFGVKCSKYNAIDTQPSNTRSTSTANRPQLMVGLFNINGAIQKTPITAINGDPKTIPYSPDRDKPADL